jgi:hypothetical protein
VKLTSEELSALPTSFTGAQAKAFVGRPHSDTVQVWHPDNSRTVYDEDDVPIIVGAGDDVYLVPAATSHMRGNPVYAGEIHSGSKSHCEEMEELRRAGFDDDASPAKGER